MRGQMCDFRYADEADVIDLLDEAYCGVRRQLVCPSERQLERTN